MPAVDLRRSPRRTALLAAAMITLLSAGAPPSWSSPDTSPPPPALQKINVLTGAHTSYIDVRLERPARLDLRRRSARPNGPNKHIEIRGKGRFVGFALRDLQSQRSGPLVVAGRYTSCRRPGCVAGDRLSTILPGEGDVRFDGSGETVPRYLELEPGDYRLYLIADDAKAKVKITLLDLVGRRLFEPKTRATFFEAKTPEAQPQLSREGSSYAAGDSFYAGGEGFFMTLLLLSGSEMGQLDWGICNYRGPSAPPNQLAYGRHCSAVPLGAGFSGSLSTGDDERFSAVLVADITDNQLPPSIDGTQGIGAWAESSGVMERAYSHTWVLGY